MEEKKNNIAEGKEMDLIMLVNKIWLAKKFILGVLGIGFITALIIAFSIPKEYTTTVFLTPESQTAGTGTMGSLAALTGINLNNNVGTDILTSPDLYPSVINSTPFLRGLLDIHVTDLKMDVDTTLYSYINDYQSAAWWSYIFKAPGLLKNLFLSNEQDLNAKNSLNSRSISEEEQNILSILTDRIVISSEKKTGITSIEVTMQSPEISAYLADTITLYLQSYIIDYRTQKARKDLEYSEKLYEESKANYYKIQANLAAYIDGNLNVVSAKFRTTQERLQNEASLAYSVYNQTAQQLQMAKIKVQDTTPVFMVIQPAVEPLFPAKPKKKLIVLGIVLMFGICAIGWVIRKDIIDMLNK